MVTKTKNRFLTMYNKLIPSLWFGLHLLIVSVCMFVVLFNRKIMSFSSTSAWTDEPAGNESTARMQDEVDLNCKF